jgi:hypothetical protein
MKVILLLTIVERVMAAHNGELLEGSGVGQCNYDCIDRNRIWCPDIGFKSGACFEYDSDIKRKVEMRDKGLYSDCSNNWNAFSGGKYYPCPLQNECQEENGLSQDFIFSPKNYDEANYVTSWDLVANSVCRYQFQFS